ncbi:MAG: hypothetical protein HYX95_01620 [Chloroflexi bacterium]|nr:hypothetical protein [Chloroflexota bacterium]
MGRRDDDRRPPIIGAGMGAAEEAVAQIAKEAAMVTAAGKLDTDMQNQRNELLWKITAQIDETKLNLEQVEETGKKLKKHLSQLQALRKILGG